MRIFKSNSTDPFVNLAWEEELFESYNNKDPWVLFYINQPCVVMGRFQHPWKECRFSLMQERKVKLLRRFSGGGTVYHDLGNLNYSFFEPRRELKKEHHGELILSVLSRLGRPGVLGEKSDLYFEGRKISGSAFKQKKEKSLHHGTLLLNADLDLLNDILRPGPYSISSKGVASRPAQVINLQVSPESFLHEFEKITSCQVEEVDPDPSASKLQSMSSYERLFQDGPPFEWSFTLPSGGKGFWKVRKGEIIEESWQEVVWSSPWKGVQLNRLPSNIQGPAEDLRWLEEHYFQWVSIFSET